MAKENTSLPSVKSPRIGSWNWPMAERGPNVMTPMRQPAAITTSGGNFERRVGPADETAAIPCSRLR